METKNCPQIELTRLDTRYGDFLVPSENDLIGDTLRAYGEWAENEISFLRRLIRPRDTVLDIGACYGTHSRAFSAAVGPEGKVISFEACKATYDILLQNIALAPIANIDAHNVALDRVSGRTVSLITSDRNRGAMHIVDSPPETKNANNALTACLDEFSLDRVDMCKIDVEGHELQVLCGAYKTIYQSRPIVFCETNSISAGINLYRSWQFEDYSVRGIRSYAKNPENYRNNDDDFFGEASECGLLFIPSERISEVSYRIPGNVVIDINETEDIVCLLLGQIQYLSKFWSTHNQRHALSDMKHKLDIL